MKRILSIILCVLMMFTMFYGCKKEEGTKNNDNSIAQKADIIKYTYDGLFNSTDKSVTDNYQDFCKALVSRQEEYKINLDLIDELINMLYTSFPLVVLVDDIKPNDDKSGVKISYKYDAQQHKVKVDEFNSKIKQTLEMCKYNEVSDAEYVLNVHKYISSNIPTNDKSDAKLYDTIITGNGNRFTYAKYFAYLVQKAGIEASQIVVDDDKLSAYSLVLIKLNDNNYYCDPYREFVDNQGENINYFCLTTDELTKLGASNLKYANNDNVEVVADDSKYEKCHSAVSYNIDNGTLNIVDNESNSFQIVL